MQSAGAAVAWQVDTHKVSFMSQLVVNWSLTTLSYPLLALLVFLAVKDENNNNKNINPIDHQTDLEKPTSHPLPNNNPVLKSDIDHAQASFN